MHPSFVLENIHTNPMEQRAKITLYTKKKFIPGVKVTGWDNYQCSQPFDKNPLCPEKYNLFSSHYNHLGGDYNVIWSTTTGDMLNQVYTRRKDLEKNPNKSLVNVYTAIEQLEHKPPLNYDNDFITTMQTSYKTPCPYSMKGLTLADPPFLQNRRFLHIPTCKLIDDNLPKYLTDLQSHKLNRHISYDFNKNKYTNGSPGYIKKSSYYNLNYYSKPNDLNACNIPD